MIIVEGSNKRNRDLVTEAANFCAKELFPRHRAYTVYIDLVKKEKWEHNPLEYGVCFQGEDDRDIYIEINTAKIKNNINELLDTVCHEMIHVKQFLKKQIRDYIEPKYRMKWLCKDGKYREYKNLPNHKLPWEVEAYKNSGKLLAKFKREFYGYEGKA